MEISLAEERAFQITPQVPLDTARVRVDDKRTGLVAGNLGALLSRPKAEDIQLLSVESRMEPFWLVIISARTRYDRSRSFTLAVSGPEVQQVTVLDHQVTVDPKAKGGPAIARSDLLVINKTDLAPHVMADLEIMERDTKTARGQRPYVFTDLLRQKGLETVIAFIEKAGGLT